MGVNGVRRAGVLAVMCLAFAGLHAVLAIRTSRQAASSRYRRAPGRQAPIAIASSERAG